MADPENIPATIAEQIYALLMAEVAKDETFDEGTLVQLQKLINQNQLTNRNAVLKAIKVQPEEAS